MWLPACELNPWAPWETDTGDTGSPTELLRIAPDDLTLFVEFGVDGAETTAVRSFSLHNDYPHTVAIWGLTDLDADESSAGVFDVMDTPDFYDLKPGGSLTVSVAFAPPPEDRSYTAEIRLRTDEEAYEEVPVPLQGHAKAPRLAWSQPSKPSTVVACAAETELVLGNAGRVALAVEVEHQDELGPFAFQEPLPTSISPGDSVQVPLTFLPTDEDDDFGAFRIVTNQPDDSGAATVTTIGVRGTVRDERVTETFHYGTGGGAHLLVLMDDVGTGGNPYQSEVFRGLEDLVVALRDDGVAFRIAAVDSENACPGSTAWGTPADSDEEIVSWLREPLFDLGVGPFADKLLELSRRALENTATGGCLQGFLASGQPLHVLVISDRDDTSPAGWRSELEDVAALHDAQVVYSAILPLSGCSSTPTGYGDAATTTGGGTWDLCSSSWRTHWTQLAALTADIEEGETLFSLAEAPLADSVMVTVEGEATDAFSVNGPVITLTDPPADGAEVLVEYTPSSACP